MLLLRSKSSETYSNRTIAVYAGSLARLLLESREEGTIGYSGSVKTGSTNSSKRDLDSEEAALYQKVQTALTDAWNAPSSEVPFVKAYLAKVEYRLGLFFRKMNPRDVHRPRARQHLSKCCDNLDADNPLHTKKLLTGYF
mmetsp:Transcript_12003/g.16783  ORF Transcript_12003/g.16783 Transcript_12003/m.16783 type:complete len:140 (+) Transcript_12003:353-772(+)